MAEVVVVKVEELREGNLLTLLGQGRVEVEAILSGTEHVYVYWRDGAGVRREIQYPFGCDVEVVASSYDF